MRNIALQGIDNKDMKQLPASKVFAQNLRKLMKQHGLNAPALSKKCNTSKRYIAQIVSENEEMNPSVNTVEDLANAFNLPGWQMLVPGIEIVETDAHEVDNLLHSFINASPEGKENIGRIAEIESHYAKKTG